MRLAFLASLLLALPVLGFAQKRDGIYQVQNGKKTAWTINAAHALLWNNIPYLPVGLAIDGSLDQLEAAKAAGVKDLLVDVPATGMSWDRVFQSLNESGMRFGIRINSLAPMAKGFIVEPQSYRVSGVVGPREIDLELPGAKSALVVTAVRRDASIQSSVRVPVVNGRLKHSIRPLSELEHVVLIYPESISLEQVDYWEELDGHRDELLASLSRRPPGVGLRFLVNPIGKTMSLPGRDVHFVPSSPTFRKELRAALEHKYRSLETAQRVWSMSYSGIDSWEVLARLVPLWYGTRGVGQLWDPETNKTYVVDQRKSTAWEDISDVITTSGARRFQRLVSAIRSVADIPVIQEWQGWSAPYETPFPSVDGIGMRSVGTKPNEIIDSGCRATSSISRWNTRGLLLATDINLGSDTEGEAQGLAVIDDLFQMGAKGAFVKTQSPKLMKLLAGEAAKRANDPASAELKTEAVYYPENANNPATAQRLPGSRWWLPSPADGNRLDLGSMFRGYRINIGGLDQYAMWAVRPGRYRVRTNESKSLRFQSLDGSDPKPVGSKTYVDVNFTDVPMIILGATDLPVPEIAYVEVVTQFDILLKEAEMKSRDVIEERIFFKDGIQSFDRQPGSAFPLLRQMVRKVSLKLGTYTWVEAESAKEHNWSDVSKIVGSSADGCLVLRTPLTAPGSGYVASYPLMVRTTTDQEVWIAARIPIERRNDVIVIIGGQPLRINSEPVGMYGNGFGWYKLGTTRLAGGQSSMRVEIATSNNQEIALDVILLTPRPFKPDGPRVPDALDYPVLQAPAIKVGK